MERPRMTDDGESRPALCAQALNPLAADALARLLDLPLSRAAALLEEYGSLGGLRRAGPAALTKRGLTARRARRLVAALDLAAAIHADRPVAGTRVASAAEAASVLLPEMARLDREHLRVLLLDTKNRLLAVVPLYQGTLSATQVRVAEVFAAALWHNAAGVIIAHNHPSGDATPSPEDVALTRALVRAGTLLDLPVLDHLVVASGGYTSLRERRLGWD